MPNDPFHQQKTLHALPPSNKDASFPLQKMPQKIAQYKVEHLFAKGGMSTLYLGSDPENKKLVIIKALASRFLSNVEAIERFLNEAEIIGMADHPNIVKLYGHGKWEGGYYIAMEFIPGVSLRQILVHVPISLKMAMQIVIQIAYAICHLHTHGIIHRDLKPENVLITNDRTIKVIDFGIAQTLSEHKVVKLGEPPRILGTPIYMSPEQREDPENVSYSSDIYSLGIITYELVLGKPSHGHIHIALMPKGLQKILQKSLQTDPKDRYQDIVDFITDVSTYLNSSDFSKDQRVNDQICELIEDSDFKENGFLATSRPSWPGIEMGLSLYKGIHDYGGFYDFISFSDDTYGIVLIETCFQGVKGLVYKAAVRGMIQALLRTPLSPVELATQLNQLVFDKKIDQQFSLNYILISQKNNELCHISCGHGDLWKKIPGKVGGVKISQSAPYIGNSLSSNFFETKSSWDLNDVFILGSFDYSLDFKTINKNKSKDQFFDEVFSESRSDLPQHFTDLALQKTIVCFFESIQMHTASFIALKRT